MDKKVTKNGKDYHRGKVYIYDKDKAYNQFFDAPEVYDDPLLFDVKTGNFHIVPGEQVFVNVKMDCIKLVGTARADIIAQLKDILKKKNESKIILNASVGWGARDLYRNIEKCVQLEKNGCKYQLNFERMYVHNSDVNCMFGLFQFYKYPSNADGINLKNGSFSMAYPASFKDSKKKPAKTDTVVYNPKLPSLFELWEDGNLEKVCKAFLNFAEEKTTI